MPYLLSGSDDFTVRVWDYQTKACIQVLSGPVHNVSSVVFHPELPLIVAAIEDGSMRMWHASTYRLEQTLSYGLDRCWSLAVTPGQTTLAAGFDEGSVVLKLGKDEPLVSMDTSGGGRICWAKHNEVQSAAVKSLGADGVASLVDGERLPLAAKEMGTADVYPTYLKYSPNGRFIAVCGDGEYIIYTAVAWRNKHYGSAREFAWGANPAYFALLESGGTVRVFKNFKEIRAFQLPFLATKLHGGALLGLQAGDFICFYDWEHNVLVRRIDVEARDVMWSEDGSGNVAIATDASVYVLRYDEAAVRAAMAEEEGAGTFDPEDGLAASFEVVSEVEEPVRSGLWVGDCFIYTNAAWRLNYAVGSETTTIVHLGKPMFVLGYLPAQQRVYLVDKDANVVTYALALTTIEVKTLILRGDFAAADALLPSIPDAELDALARFFDGRGFPEKAFAIAVDPDLRFELAMQLGRLSDAVAIASLDDSGAKWHQVADLALKTGEMAVATDALMKARDVPGLVMIHASTGNAEGMASVGQLAVATGDVHAAVLAHFLTGQVDACVDLLVMHGRLPEAAIFARTYCPGRLTDVVARWRKNMVAGDLTTSSEAMALAAEALADPETDPTLFPNHAQYVRAAEMRSRLTPTLPAAAYAANDGEVTDLITRMGSMGNGVTGVPSPMASPVAASPVASPVASPKAPASLSPRREVASPVASPLVSPMASPKAASPSPPKVASPLASPSPKKASPPPPPMIDLLGMEDDAEDKAVEGDSDNGGSDDVSDTWGDDANATRFAGSEEDEEEKTDEDDDADENEEDDWGTRSISSQ